MKKTDKNSQITNDPKPPKKRGGGPKTPEGKRRSCMNSRRHGLTAEYTTFTDDEVKMIREILDDYTRDFRPHNKITLDLVQELAVCQLRLRRIWEMEGWTFALTIDKQAPRIDSEYQDASDGMRASIALAQLANSGNALGLLNRYESRCTRRMHQILADLKALGCVPPAVDDEPQPDTSEPLADDKNTSRPVADQNGETNSPRSLHDRVLSAFSPSALASSWRWTGKEAYPARWDNWGERCVGAEYLPRGAGIPAE